MAVYQGISKEIYDGCHMYDDCYCEYQDPLTSWYCYQKAEAQWEVFLKDKLVFLYLCKFHSDKLVPKHDEDLQDS